MWDRIMASSILLRWSLANRRIISSLDFNLEAFLIEDIFIMKKLTDSRKTVETSVDPQLSTFHISPLMVIYKLKNAQVKLIPFLAF